MCIGTCVFVSVYRYTTCNMHTAYTHTSYIHEEEGKLPPLTVPLLAFFSSAWDVQQTLQDGKSMHPVCMGWCHHLEYPFMTVFP